MIRTVFTQFPKRRCYSTTDSFAELDKWINSPKQLILSDAFHIERMSDLYITIPTRDGTRAPFKEPQTSTPLGYGHHLAFFHPRKSENHLRPDGTENDFCPPAPFTRRMWAGGKMIWNNDSPLTIGGRAIANCTIGSVGKKGFTDGGKSPKVFVTQKIELSMLGKEPSIIEERSHVYLSSAAGVDRTIREVKDIPSSPPDFSFTYTPTMITLFRFSALMFNAHHIHLDQEYAQKKQGYPERLVHGPLTAMMLLEIASLNNPDRTIKSFEYRARNPVIVNQPSTINGVKKDGNTVFLWCVDGDGVVGMTGLVHLV
ncbi:hypothetical protein BDZ94DRAFT_1216020 [Collybia nuda]|uniref:Uncharacterized protein n=1 Tax=Collybia nuda TaxID=64659 RepID=A0A9P5YAC1_9AGAR|nr:hypothetical protein BDZ94DRAFT_1216020 [Collybia nuda]